MYKEEQYRSIVMGTVFTYSAYCTQHTEYRDMIQRVLYSQLRKKKKEKNLFKKLKWEAGGENWLYGCP